MFSMGFAFSTIVGVSGTLLISAAAEFILNKCGKPELAKTLKLIVSVAGASYVFYNIYELVQFIISFHI